MDLNAIMKQAQAMPQKLQDAQAKMGETTVDGTAGGGMARLTLDGTGALKAVHLDPELLKPEEAEVLGDLLVAAHADAKRKLDEANAALMREAAGPMAGMSLPGMPKLF